MSRVHSRARLSLPIVLLAVTMAGTVGAGKLLPVGQGLSAPAKMTAQAPGPPPGNRLSDIDSYITAQIQAWRVPGASVVIVEGGRIAHARGFGVADDTRREVTAATPFEIGSCTKSFTALAILQLVEQGQVTLDDPVREHLPWFSLAGGGSGDITLRHLLNHTSGIPHGASARLMTRRSGMTLRGQAELLAVVRPFAQPGEIYAYNNYNYILLALVVETITGLPYGEYIEQHIFEPLGMQDSHTDMRAAQGQGLPDGHVWWWGFPRRVRPQANDRPDMLGAGYLFVSARDMGNYLLAQLGGAGADGSRVLSADGFAGMHQRTKLPSGESAYGLGWVSYSEGGQTIVSHNGAGPGFTSSIFLIPERELGIAVFTNTAKHFFQDDLHAAWLIADRVRGMLLGAGPAAVSRAHSEFFRIWNAAFLALTGLIAAGIVQEARRLLAGQPPSRSWSGAVVHGLAALGAIVGMPLALGTDTWLASFVYMPDAAWWCLMAGLLLAARAVLSRLGRRVPLRHGARA